MASLIFLLPHLIPKDSDWYWLLAFLFQPVSGRPAFVLHTAAVDYL